MTRMGSHTLNPDPDARLLSRGSWQHLLPDPGVHVCMDGWGSQQAQGHPSSQGFEDCRGLGKGAGETLESSTTPRLGPPRACPETPRSFSWWGGLALCPLAFLTWRSGAA